MNWRFWRKQYKISILANDYNLKIVKKMSADDKIDMYFWDYVKEELNADRKWSRKTGQNYLVFNNKQDYTVFLLRFA
jgi:hypothetical protein